MGRLADRFGITVPCRRRRTRARRSAMSRPARRDSLVAVRAGARLADRLLGSSATFGPLMADISHWFIRRRGIAVAHLRLRQLSRRHDLAAGRAAFHRQRRLARDPYRHRRVLRRHHAAARAVAAAAGSAPAHAVARAADGGARGRPAASLSPNALQALLCVAGLACCVAMSMPQVHIVAYCGDLGYGVGARRGDAVADARLRHRQPDRLRLHRRPHRRRAHAAARLGCCRDRRCCSICCSTG